MIGRVRTAATALLLLALAGVTAHATVSETIFDGASGVPLLAWTALGWALFGLAWWAVRGVPRRAATALVVAGTVLVGAAAMAGPPNTSTDSARYAWDGIVGDAGVSPYAHPPAADALDPLREAWLFPEPVVADGTPHCRGTRVTSVRTVPDGDLLCTTLNRPSVPTIYPPAAQGWFALVRAGVPPTATWWPMQLAGALVVVAVTLLLMRMLARRGLDPRWAAWWGWCPFVASEAVTNSHVDVLGVALVVAATLVAVPRRGAGARPALVGVLLGLAAAVKFVPVVAGLPLTRRRPGRVVAAAAATVAAVYVPYVVATGWDVVGYLPGYAREQGYESGSGFTLAATVLPGAAAIAVSLVALGVIAVLQWRLADPDDPWTAQLVGAGAMLVVVASPYPWYALVLVPFIALTRRWEWFVVPVVMTAHLLVPDAAGMRLCLLVSVAVVTAGWLARRRRSVDAQDIGAPVREEVRV
jgi:hypothetical protein